VGEIGLERDALARLRVERQEAGDPALLAGVEPQEPGPAGLQLLHLDPQTAERPGLGQREPPREADAGRTASLRRERPEPQIRLGPEEGHRSGAPDPSLDQALETRVAIQQLVHESEPEGIEADVQLLEARRILEHEGEAAARAALPAAEVPSGDRDAGRPAVAREGEAARAAAELRDGDREPAELGEGDRIGREVEPERGTLLRRRHPSLPLEPARVGPDLVQLDLDGVPEDRQTVQAPDREGLPHGGREAGDPRELDPHREIRMGESQRGERAAHLAEAHHLYRLAVRSRLEVPDRLPRARLRQRGTPRRPRLLAGPGDPDLDLPREHRGVGDLEDDPALPLPVLPVRLFLVPAEDPVEVPGAFPVLRQVEGEATGPHAPELDPLEGKPERIVGHVDVLEREERIAVRALDHEAPEHGARDQVPPDDRPHLDPALDRAVQEVLEGGGGDLASRGRLADQHDPAQRRTVPLGGPPERFGVALLRELEHRIERALRRELRGPRFGHRPHHQRHRRERADHQHDREHIERLAEQLPEPEPGLDGLHRTGRRWRARRDHSPCSRSDCVISRLMT